MKCHALHGFGASASLGGGASGHFGGLHGLQPSGVWSWSGFITGWSCEFNAVPGSSWGWSKMGFTLCQGLWFVGILGMTGGLFVGRVEVLGLCGV